MNGIWFCGAWTGTGSTKTACSLPPRLEGLKRRPPLSEAAGMSCSPHICNLCRRCATRATRPRAPFYLSRIFALLNVDDLDAAQSASALIRRPVQSFSIRLKDHGPKTQKLRPFIDNLLAKRGLAQSEQIFILCYPRILVTFNPLTVYYCLNDGAVSALVYEVRNTFGDDHIYVVPVGARGNETSLSHAREKQMHVSPFIDMQATYHFLRRSG